MSSFSNKGIDTSSTATTIFHAIIVYILIVVVFIFFPYRLKYLYDGLSRPIPHWQVVMFIMLLIIAILQLVDAIMYASGHNSHLGQEVMADNLIRTYTEIDGSFFTRVLALRYLYLLCDLLQTLVFTIAILQSARYSPRDQRMFYRILRVEYTSLGILAIWDLFYNFLWPYVGQYYARLLTNYEQFLAFEAILLLTVSTRVIHVVLTIILLAASIDLEMQSNPAREISKALHLLVAGTTVLFVRSIVGLVYIILRTYYVNIPWPWSLRPIEVMTMMVADELLLQAENLQRSNSSPMPAWLLGEMEIED